MALPRGSWSFQWIAAKGYTPWDAGPEPYDFPSNALCTWNHMRFLRRGEYWATSDGTYNGAHAAYCPSLAASWPAGGVADQWSGVTNYNAGSGGMRVGWRQHNYEEKVIAPRVFVSHELRMGVWPIAASPLFANLEVGDIEKYEVMWTLTSPDEIAPDVDFYLFGMNQSASVGPTIYYKTYANPLFDSWQQSILVGEAGGSTTVPTGGGTLIGTGADAGTWVELPLDRLYAGTVVTQNGAWAPPPGELGDLDPDPTAAAILVVPRVLDLAAPPETLPADPGQLRRFVMVAITTRITYRTAPLMLGVLRVKDQSGAWLPIACDHGPGVLRLLAPDPLPGPGGIPAGWTGMARWYTVCPDPAFHGMSATGAFNLKAMNPLPMFPGQTGGPGVQWLSIGCMLPGDYFGGNPT